MAKQSKRVQINGNLSECTTIPLKICLHIYIYVNIITRLKVLLNNKNRQKPVFVIEVADQQLSQYSLFPP